MVWSGLLLLNYLWHIYNDCMVQVWSGPDPLPVREGGEDHRDDLHARRTQAAGASTTREATK